jgi:protein-S-isoprenylcysteine O-methyltransferase Ste14
MTTLLPSISTAAYAVTFVAEKVMLRGRKVSGRVNRDRRSLEVFKISGALTVPAGIILGFTETGRVRAGYVPASLIGLALMLCGTGLRWAAIRTLRRYFTVNVTILEDHRIVRRGLYRRLRHPSYAGLLLRYFGFGLSFSNWLSLALIFLPMLAAILYRIRVEEAALEHAFGDEYADYARATKRLIPGVY